MIWICLYYDATLSQISWIYLLLLLRNCWETANQSVSRLSSQAMSVCALHWKIQENVAITIVTINWFYQILIQWLTFTKASIVWRFARKLVTSWSDFPFSSSAYLRYRLRYFWGPSVLRSNMSIARLIKSLTSDSSADTELKIRRWSFISGNNKLSTYEPTQSSTRLSTQKQILIKLITNKCPLILVEIWNSYVWKLEVNYF